jgi:ceramide glucosyltransferase
MDAAVSAWLGLAWWSAGSAIHWASAALARRPRRLAPAAAALRPISDFSIVAPMSGVGDATEAYVRSLQALSRAGAEILICIARADDGAIAPTRALWPEAPILVGTDATFNPKMNNVRKGLEAARRPIVALCDAGILAEAEQLSRAAAPLSDTVGLVLALKAAVSVLNFAAELECSYINGHHARFLFAADRLGLAVASGGITLMTNQTLQRIGNWRGFNRWIADDYSVTRAVREVGLATRLGDVMLRLPLGRRDWPTVWRRQVRWARTRLRLPVWPLVLWEPLIGGFISGLAGAVALKSAGAANGVVVAGLALHTLAWLGGEKWFMAGRGLAFGPRAAAAALLRELLAPVLMLTALSGRSIDWRGTDLAGQWRERRDDATGKPV